MAGFDTFLHQYDFWMQTIEGVNRFHRFIGFLPKCTHRALDAGCGSGGLSLLLSEHFDSVTGVDISRPMIEAAKTRNNGQQSNIDFIIADLEHLPFESETFDFIVSLFSLHHTQITTTLPALRRLIAPGGRMVLRDTVSSRLSQTPKSPLRHRLHALRNIPKYLRRYDISTAWQLVSFEMSPAWIRHQIHDDVELTFSEFQAICHRCLPDCVCEKSDSVITILWEAPGRRTVPRAPQTGPHELGEYKRFCPTPISNTEGPDFLKEEIETSIPERFERVAVQYSSHIAIKVGREMLTYQALDKVSNQVAHAILAQRDEGTEPIALILDHGISLIVAMLGVLKAGKCYAALSTSSPRVRLVDILEDMQADLIITDQKHSSLASELLQKNGHLLYLDDIDNFSSEKTDFSISPNSLAGIFYTSGSTGNPKGSMRDHRHILYTAWKAANEYYVGNKDRYSLLFYCDTTASVPDIFGTLLNGATLCFYNPREAGLNQLVNWLIQEEITIFRPLISLFRQFLDILEGNEHFSKLRLLILGGQSIYKHDVEKFKKYFPVDCILLHWLGLTEAGVVTQLFIDQQTRITNDVIPVGYAVAERKILILDEAGQELEDNHVGEIAVKSQYLSQGYWRKTVLTRQTFLPDPETDNKRIYLTGDLGWMRSDGCLEYLGRKDFQVKVQGYRVVLTEIESALCALNDISNAVVLARQGLQGETSLIAYIVPFKSPGPSVETLRAQLEEALPEYMIPTYFTFLEELPLTPTGKVDRRLLPEPEMTRPTMSTPFVAPQTDLEQQLVTWCENILGINPIGVDDNLLDLGLHSLQALRLLLELEKGTGIQIAPAAFAQSGTITQIIRLIEGTHQHPGGIPNNDPGSSHQTEASASPVLHARKLTLLEQLLNLQLGDWRFPYAIGITLLSWACATPWGQRRYLRQGNLAPIRQLLPLLGNVRHTGRVLRQHVLVNTKSGQEWYLAALMRSSPRQFDRWVTVIGLDMLQECLRQGRGIIFLDGHFGPKGLIGVVLDRLGFKQVLLLIDLLPPSSARAARRRQRKQAYRFHQTLSLAPSERLSSLYTAAQVLTEQGMVYMTPDGRGGEGGVKLPFLGRQRVFRSGFAELALMSNAIVLPVLGAMTVQGRITVEFLPPLDTGTTDQSDQERVASLIQHYASFLEQRWRDAPANIHAEQIHGFLQLPQIFDSVHKEQ